METDMHMPHTVIENREVIGWYCGTPLYRWTEENATRVFEERLMDCTTASGARFRTSMVFEVSSATGARSTHGLTYYTKVSYHDEPSESESFDNEADAHEAYAELIGQALDGALGDVAGCSWGRFLPHGKRRVFASRQFV